MKKFEIPLVFLCSGSMDSGDQRLSYRIAKQLQDMGVANLGNLGMLATQRLHPPGCRRRMIFINDCKATCVKLLMQGFEDDQYLFFDISSRNESKFDINQFIQEILHKMTRNWR